MKYTVLIILGCMLSNCAVPFAQGVTAKDVISRINTVNNLNKYSEPAAREELENRIKQMARSIGAGAEVQ